MVSFLMWIRITSRGKEVAGGTTLAISGAGSSITKEQFAAAC